MFSNDGPNLSNPEVTNKPKLIPNKYSEIKSQKPLFDIIISNIKDYSKYDNFPNYMIGFILIFILFPLIIKPNLNYFKSLFNRYATIQ